MAGASASLDSVESVSLLDMLQYLRQVTIHHSVALRSWCAWL